MITSIEFKNFKCLRDTTLPLERFTLLIGPNGSGKTTALTGLQLFYDRRAIDTPFDKLLSIGADEQVIELSARWEDGYTIGRTELTQQPGHDWLQRVFEASRDAPDNEHQVATGDRMPTGLAMYGLNAGAVAEPSPLVPVARLEPDGASLATVLDRLRDDHPERYEAVNDAIHRWLPEYDCILFETPGKGLRSIRLRTTDGHYPVAAADLSQGTLLTLALLTLTHVPDPPGVVAIEEPDRGIHPRLLRRVSDALYRLAYPEDHGEDREPTQVIATTHAPYMLDLYRDHPEQVVIADKRGLEAQFTPLSEHSAAEHILGEATLGEMWYSGLLGGAPVEA